MYPNSTQRRKRILHRRYNLPINKNHAAQNHHQEEYSHNSVRKKPDGLICAVCEGPAYGYNFDAISCESCKAFFRRNALRSDKKLQCRASDNQCIITVTTRKYCKACRLAKCFRKGMRSDWILSNEELVQKRMKIEQNRRLRQMFSSNSITSNESISSDPKQIFLKKTDMNKVQQIQQAYEESIQLVSLPASIPPYPYLARICNLLDMLNIPVHIQALRLITYFKLLPEFSSLNEDDKFILVKYNTFPLVFIRSSLNYNQLTDRYHENGTDDCVFSGQDFIQCFSLFQYVQSTRLNIRLLNATVNDRLIIQLLLIIILFSKGSSIVTSIDESELISNDVLSIYHRQNIFVDLLWKYCEKKFGFSKTITIWLELVTISIDVHRQAHNIRQNYIKNEFVADQLVPLMKSVTLVV